MQAFSTNRRFFKKRVYTPPIMAGRPPTKEAPPFGKRLSEARRSKGLSQSELADLLGVSAKAVDYYERRARNPSVDFVSKTAEALSVSFDDLVGGADKKAQKPGPSKKLLRQLEQIQSLPKSKQRFVSELLDTVLDTNRP
jgi:transcriptional regulator with XRE-family HTH domain